MNRCQYCLLLLVSFAFASAAWAQTKSEWIDFQGEYKGKYTNGDDDELDVGIQVIAKGDNKFSVTVFADGLPGDGVSGGKPDSNEPNLEGILEGGQLVFADDHKLVIKDGVATLYRDEKQIGLLHRLERESETLAMSPPENAIVLFDGTNGDNFERKNGEGSVLEDGFLRQGIISKQKFGGDFKVHIEFKLPFEPERQGQARGNSGIYLQGRYEVQMLDSFGLTGEHNECGGIYSIKKPDLNMCYPPERWQTYDIEFKSAKWDGDEKTENARMTVRHNGVLIHDDVEVPKTTTAAPLKESSKPGYLFLQDHNSQVRYRNIWVVQQ